MIYMVKVPLLRIKPSFIKYDIVFFLLLKIKLFLIISKSFYILWKVIIFHIINHRNRRLRVNGTQRKNGISTKAVRFFGQ